MERMLGRRELPGARPAALQESSGENSGDPQRASPRDLGTFHKASTLNSILPISVAQPGNSVFLTYGPLGNIVKPYPFPSR